MSGAAEQRHGLGEKHDGGRRDETSGDEREKEREKGQEGGAAAADGRTRADSEDASGRCLESIAAGNLAATQSVA